jgi:hypothetical protein
MAERPTTVRVHIRRLTIELEGNEQVAQNLQVMLERLLTGSGGNAAPQASISVEGSFEEDEAPALPAPRRRGRPRKNEAPPQVQRKRRTRRAQGLTVEVRRLVDSGFFSQPRSAADVKAQLREQGLEEGMEQLYGSLKYLAERGQLVRERDEAQDTLLYSAPPQS